MTIWRVIGFTIRFRSDFVIQPILNHLKMPSIASVTKTLHVCDSSSNIALGPYPGNTVSSTKYTPLNFIFKNLFLQFQKIANVYFLCAGLIELVPQFTITNGVPTYIFPLTFILMVTAIKDLLEDLSRRRADRQENERSVEIFDYKIQQKFLSKKWSQVCVGDIVRINNREMLPADLIMVASSTEGGLVYVSTANLDGETNLKLRKVHPDLNLHREKKIVDNKKSRASGHESSDDDDDEPALSLKDGCRALRESVIECELPNKYLHKFDGSLSFSTHYLESEFYEEEVNKSKASVPLSRENILLRSVQLRNTKWVVGIVVSAGVDTKIQMNVAPAPHKTSK